MKSERLTESLTITGRNGTDDATRTRKEAPPAVRRAVILAAGKGDRLQPLTALVPKCLVEVAGEPLLERALRALFSQGVAEVVIVVGYKGEVVRERIGSRFAGVDIVFVEAPDSETTNNIRSLWDAREYLDEDVLLLDADIVFEPTVIFALLNSPGSSAAVAPYRRALSGTVVRRDGLNQVTSLTLRADQGPRFDTADAFKTVNIYLLREQLLRDQFVPRLCNAIEAGRVHEYYESILGDCVADGSLTNLSAIEVPSGRWYEIDDHRDLDVAQFIFLDRNAQFDRIKQLHGGYWRYGLTDHSYLYNMHFPPTEMIDVFQENLRDIVTNYPVAQGELARIAAGWNGANPDHLAVANGAAELIRILGSQFIRRLTIPAPSFNEYEEVTVPEGLNRFPLDPPTFELDINAFAESAIAWHSDTAVVVTPNNPTAVSIPRKDVLNLAGILEPHRCRLIVDESFIEFSRAGSAESVEEMVEACPNLVIIKSLSKVFGVAGLRAGYLLSADRDFIEAVRRCLPIWNINGLAEEFLHTVGRYRKQFAQSCDRTRAACDALYRDLLKMPGVEPVKSDANFVLCKLTGPADNGPEIARRLYVQHNILVKDCAGKSMPEADRYLRIASRTPAENQRLAAALAESLEATDGKATT